MSKATCNTCQQPKATLQCGLCQSDLCKNCAQFMPDEAFSFLKKIPKDLMQNIYCITCYDDKVAVPLAAYTETMELAKNVNVYFKTQGKETRAFKRKEPPVEIEDCPDYDEALLRLAFLAAVAKFNALIDVQMNSKKLIVNGYHSTLWSGTGIPTHVTAKQLNVGIRDTN